MATKTSETYVWEGINNKGAKVSGEIDSSSMAMAKAELRSQGISPSKMKKKPKGLFSSGKEKGKKLKPGDIAVILRQVSTMLGAGIAVVQTLDLLGQGQTNPTAKKVILDIKSEVESGQPFSKALRKYPMYFTSLYCNLLEAGEQSGSLDEMLDRVATYAEKTESLKKKIKKALVYPVAVIIVALLISTGLLLFVVPRFQEIFASFGAELPLPTQMVINLSEMVQSYWWLFLTVIVGSVVGLRTAYRKNPKVEEAMDKFSLKIPIIGVILEKAAVARFARTLSITFAAGLPLTDALTAVAGATGNVLFAKGTMRIREEVTTGQKIQKSMHDTGLFPLLVVQMVGIGEESGSLEFMLSKVADFFEEDVDNAVDNLSALLEPVIMVVLGGIVGGLIVALYLPIFKLGDVIK